ncbi:MAG TPA: glycosyltransferase [Verrucomicrobiae bacterium]|nr:glycosyltransferase [Verrucomicrobiae bacterium]
MRDSIYGMIWMACYVLLAGGLSIYCFHRLFILFLYFRHKADRPEPQSRFAQLPFITVQIPLYNEMYVAGRLLDAVAAIDYPRDRLEIQVLDDSTDDTVDLVATKVADLQARGFAAEHVRRGTRQGFKAGALAHGLNTARGEFLAIFDADFIPNPNIFRRCIDHFTDTRLGMIQTRWDHLNRDYSLLTRLQAIFLDGHLLLEQTARARSGRFFNFNGTAGIWRKDCIVDADGWHADTLTEDLDLSYRAQLAQWRFLFLPDLVTPAELPVEMNAFKTQQHRWAKGSIQTCKKLLPAVWRAPLSLPIKIEATFHLTSNFAYLLFLLLCVIVNPAISPQRTEILLPWLPDLPIFSCAVWAVVLFYIVVLRELRPRWWLELWCIPAVLALGVGMSISNAKAVLEAMFNQGGAFVRTPKYGLLSRGEPWRGKRYFAMPSALVLFELAAAAYFAEIIWIAARDANWGSVPFLFFFFGGFAYVAATSLMPPKAAAASPNV